MAKRPSKKPAPRTKPIATKRAASKPSKPRKPAPTPPKSPPRSARKSSAPLLLSGDNPQIPKSQGDAPVQSYIAAIPGWKRDLARRVDAIIVHTFPAVHKAVKWNSPLYGTTDNSWFLSMHCFTNYLKIAFFRGTSLRPMPPGESKAKDTRYLDIRQHDEFNQPQFVNWIKQASRLPGERL